MEFVSRRLNFVLLLLFLCATLIPPTQDLAAEPSAAASPPAKRRLPHKKAKPGASGSATAPAGKAQKAKSKPKPAVKKKAGEKGAPDYKPLFQQDSPQKNKPEPRQAAIPIAPAIAPAVPVSSNNPPIAPAVPVTPDVVITKSDTSDDEEPTPPPPPVHHPWWRLFGRNEPNYRYLTPDVRRAIERTRVSRHRWRYIVVHNSGTRQGSARVFDYYHRKVRRMSNGLAYHFVIGNGTSTGNGAIEIGPRWTSQLNGGHVHSDYLNSIALGICLVGDFNRERPTRQQMEALEELIQFLRQQVGKTDRRQAMVRAHCEINPPPWTTDCPGSRFPYNWLRSKFRD